MARAARSRRLSPLVGKNGAVDLLQAASLRRVVHGPAVSPPSGRPCGITPVRLLTSAHITDPHAADRPHGTGGQEVPGSSPGSPTPNVHVSGPDLSAWKDRRASLLIPCESRGGGRGARERAQAGPDGELRALPGARDRPASNSTPVLIGWGVRAPDPCPTVDDVRRAAWGVSRHGVTPGKHFFEVAYPQGRSFGSRGSAATLCRGTTDRMRPASLPQQLGCMAANPPAGGRETCRETTRTGGGDVRGSQRVAHRLLGRPTGTPQRQAYSPSDR